MRGVHAAQPQDRYNLMKAFMPTKTWPRMLVCRLYITALLTCGVHAAQPQDRYNLMKAYMPTVGSMGLDMMFRTCTVQVGARGGTVSIDTRAAASTWDLGF